MKTKMTRLVMIVVFAVIATITRKRRFRWMLNFLLGKGGRKVIPTSCVGEVLRTLYEVSDKQPGRHCLDHSLCYEGSGFSKRPELFYMVGGFTFHIEKVECQYKISFEDAYDWHPNDEGQWFTSPLPNPLWWIGNKIFGEDYFPREGFPSGIKGVSNKFFHALEEVGAKPFVSVFEGTFDDIDIGVICPSCLLRTQTEDFSAEMSLCRWCEEDLPSRWEEIFCSKEQAWYNHAYDTCLENMSDEEIYQIFFRDF